MSVDDIADSMYSGIRRAQDLCYCRDWSEFKTIDIKDNPFGYDKRTLIKKAMKASGYTAISDEVYQGEDSPDYVGQQEPAMINVASWADLN
jgi:hypothetical protein